MHSLADSTLCPDGDVEPATLAYGDDALTNWWATQTGQEWDFWEFLMQTLASSVHSVVNGTNKFARTTESCGGKGTARPLSQGESTSSLVLTGFYWLSNSMYQRRSSFIIHRFALGNYILQRAKERMLLITSYRLTRKKCCKCKGMLKSNWSGYTSVLGTISTDFRKLL